MKKLVGIMVLVMLVCNVCSAQTMLHRVWEMARSAVQSHIDDTSNPHSVTAAQVGVHPVLVDTNSVTVTTAYTPVGVGQFLTGKLHADTNALWSAYGATTNDWGLIWQKP